MPARLNISRERRVFPEISQRYPNDDEFLIARNEQAHRNSQRNRSERIRNPRSAPYVSFLFSNNFNSTY